MDFAVWLSGDGRQSCRECLEAYERASRPTRWDTRPPEKKEPPCATCRPRLSPMARPVADLLVRVQRQWVLDGRGRPLTLRYEAVAAAVDRSGCPADEQQELIDQVMHLGDVMVECFNRGEE